MRYTERSVSTWYVGGVKGFFVKRNFRNVKGFNPAYVGGGDKTIPFIIVGANIALGFNPWYVGGGVKSHPPQILFPQVDGFNPWYVGGGVKSQYLSYLIRCYRQFQSLVCWRGC